MLPNVLYSRIPENFFGIPGNSKPIFRGVMPLPPGVNDCYTVRDGRIVATKELVQFKHDAAFMLADYATSIQDYALVNAIRSNKKYKTPLALRMRFYKKTLWKRDEDGGVKPGQDALFHHLDLNDNLVIDLYASKHVDASNPRTEVALYIVS